MAAVVAEQLQAALGRAVVNVVLVGDGAGQLVHADLALVVGKLGMTAATKARTVASGMSMAEARARALLSRLISKPSCMRRSMSTRRPVTHLGSLASASAAIRSSCQRANSLTVGLGFFVSATFEILDDAPQLVFGDVLVFHRAQHGWNEVVLLHNAGDIRGYLPNIGPVERGHFMRRADFRGGPAAAAMAWALRSGAAGAKRPFSLS